MYRIEWSQTALIDLETILAYYTQEVSVKLAKKIFLRIQKQIDLLEHFPEGTRL
jgi:plasmid stabilization system protein ParE